MFTQQIWLNNLKNTIDFFKTSYTYSLAAENTVWSNG